MFPSRPDTREKELMMKLVFRPTTTEDVLAAEAVLSDGKAALAALDVPQWQGEYPNSIDIITDIEHGVAYVAADEAGTILGTLALTFDGDDTYDVIDGAWLTSSSSTDARYAVIHRCAVSAAAARQGIMTFMFEECEHLAVERGCESMRIDTHRNNLPMQGLIAKRGYTSCGTITLPSEGEIDPERLAFEKVL